MPPRTRPRPRQGSLVLLDTNAALLPFREALPLADEVDRWLPGAELAVPDSVRAELDRLVARGARHARAARAFVERLRAIPTSARGDRAVVEAAARLRATVVTADRVLAEELRRSGVAVLVPRDRARLELRLPRPPTARRPRPRQRVPFAKR